MDTDAGSNTKPIKSDRACEVGFFFKRQRKKECVCVRVRERIRVGGLRGGSCTSLNASTGESISSEKKQLIKCGWVIRSAQTICVHNVTS